ncbi:hypothetical protein [Klenkia brasiliensis]|uniref:Haloacid dehalogenase-like hydrolase n=1 Tax=Klenkia brasiliensis TaxID=333142 RepID=A0A1G7MWH3_9ACTN|nr:hypothetical protein [Klenkia brasiliensis]SDF65469.1 hypothetical protein SAMN05660324_0788 [Klenkia brasiliensis]
MAVATFDVFETVLVRALGGPEHVAEETGRLLRARCVLPVSPAVYAAARRAAQDDRTPDVAVHPRLADLARDVADRLGVPGAAAHLEAAELEVERAACRAVPGAVARVDAARAATGRGVVFVSDTPLPAAFLVEVLRREGLFRDGDDLVASADTGSSKQHGALFDVVRERLGDPAGELRHTGDDRWSDGVHALERGWQVTLDGSAHLAGRERLLAAGGRATDGLAARLAAAARTARLQGAAAGLDAGLVSVAGTVALPLFAGFARWVLDEAARRGLDRLYFVARDGEVLREVTARLAASRPGAPELRYLHGSRRSWTLASAGRPGHDVLADLWVPDGLAVEDLSPRELLHLLDLDPDEAAALDPAAVPPGTADRPLGAGAPAFLAALASGPVGAEAARRAGGRADLLLAYLDQEGVTAPGRVGFVDVGWTGRATRALEDLLTAAGRPVPAAHLFVGLLAPAQRTMGDELFDRSAGWLLDEARGRHARSRPGEDPVMLVETLAMGGEGTTTGFAERDGRVGPVLSAPVNPATAGWGFADYRAALDLAVAAFVDGDPPGTAVDLRPTAWQQLLDLWRHPTRAEALAWGAQPYGEDFANQRWWPLARPLTARRLLRRAGVGPATWREPTFWLAGTVRLSPGPVRWAARWLGRVDRSRLARVPLRVRRELLLRRRG